MYIAVNADNGFGVYSNRTRLNKSKEWMRKPVEKKFDTLEDAKFHALDIYNDYQDDFDDYYDSDNDPKFKINWFYSKSYIRKLNRK